jgi:hypothetical protein
MPINFWRLLRRLNASLEIANGVAAVAVSAIKVRKEVFFSGQIARVPIVACSSKSGSRKKRQFLPVYRAPVSLLPGRDSAIIGTYAFPTRS